MGVPVFLLAGDRDSSGRRLSEAAFIDYVMSFRSCVIAVGLLSMLSMAMVIAVIAAGGHPENVTWLSSHV